MIVYKLTNLANGKAYVGITIRTFARRWSQHLAYSKAGTGALIGRAIKKYGADGFKREILYEASSFAELLVCERALIAAHGTYAPRGYNLTAGGEGAAEVIRTPEYRLKLKAAAERRMKEGTWFAPRKVGEYKPSPEARAKMSAAALARIARGEGNPPPQSPGKLFHVLYPDAARKAADTKRGKKRSEDQKARMRAAVRAIGRIKLTDGQVAEIKRRLALGARVGALAKEFGVSQSHVSHIKGGRDRYYVTAASHTVAGG